MKTLYSLATLALLALASVAPAADEAVGSKGSFVSAGRTVGVTRFDAPGKGPHPALVLLHGIDGPVVNRAAYYQMAQCLASRGYVVYFVSYFDVFADRPAELAAFRTDVKAFATTANGPNRERTARSFDACTAAVADAVRFVRDEPGVDGRVGVVGVSLGGFVATATAIEKDLGVHAVVELFGGLPVGLHNQAANLPPTLIVHGTKDAVVPIDAAHRLAELLTKKQMPHRPAMYDTGHVFLREDGSFDRLNAVLAEVRVGSFLKDAFK